MKKRYPQGGYHNCQVVVLLMGTILISSASLLLLLPLAIEQSGAPPIPNKFANAITICDFPFNHVRFLIMSVLEAIFTS